GRLGWALDEFEQLRSRHAEPPDPELAWWRIKEARRLKGRARCVAQAVAGWRERRARRGARPVRRVRRDPSGGGVGGQLARDAALDTSLVATRADIEGLVRGDPGSRLLSGWRAEVAGEPVRRLLEGRAALAFDGEGSLVIEARSHRPMTPDHDGSDDGA